MGNEIEGKKKDQPVIITGKDHANRLGKKRRNNILKFYALDKKDDVRKYVVRRSFEKKTKDGEAITRKNGDKTFYKAPKVQRMITETKIRRKKVARRNVIDGIKNSQKKATDYEKLLKEYFAEKKEVKNTSVSILTTTKVQTPIEVYDIIEEGVHQVRNDSPPPRHT